MTGRARGGGIDDLSGAVPAYADDRSGDSERISIGEGGLRGREPGRSADTETGGVARPSLMRLGDAPSARPFA